MTSIREQVNSSRLVLETGNFSIFGVTPPSKEGDPSGYNRFANLLSDVTSRRHLTTDGVLLLIGKLSERVKGGDSDSLLDALVEENLRDERLEESQRRSKPRLGSV